MKYQVKSVGFREDGTIHSVEFWDGSPSIEGKDLAEFVRDYDLARIDARNEVRDYAEKQRLARAGT